MNNTIFILIITPPSEVSPLYELILLGEGGVGVLHNIFVNWVQHMIKKWTLSDLRFCKNEGSKLSNINEKGGQLDRKSRRKLIQNA